MAKVSPLMLAPPALFAGGAVLFYIGMFREGKNDMESVFVGKPAPQIENTVELPGFDAQGRTAIDWGVTAPPETFILDANGIVLYRFAGPLVGSDFEQRFLPELTKALGQ